MPKSIDEINYEKDFCGLDLLNKPETIEKPKFQLSQEHYLKAKEIIQSHIMPRYKYKHTCKRCKGDGIQGITDENLIIPCKSCVNLYPVMNEWLIYADQFPELKKRFILGRRNVTETNRSR